MNIPHFAFYPADWRSDPRVDQLTIDEEGAYFRLLTHMWCGGQECTLPDDNTVLKRLWKVDDARVQALRLVLIDGPFAPLHTDGRRLTCPWLIKQYLRLTNPASALARDPRRPRLEEWRQLREYVFERDDYTCQYCWSRGGKLECDHLIPIAKGGTNDVSNLVTACRPCNRSKRDKTVEEWLA